MQNCLRQGGLQIPKKHIKPRPTYKFRFKKGPETKLFYLTKCKIFLGKRSCNSPNHYVYLYI